MGFLSAFFHIEVCPAIDPVAHNFPPKKDYLLKKADLLASQFFFFMLSFFSLLVFRVFCSSSLQKKSLTLVNTLKSATKKGSVVTANVPSIHIPFRKM